MFFFGFGVSQQGACVLRCLRRFGTLRKTRPWSFGACTLCVLLILMASLRLHAQVLDPCSNTAVSTQQAPLSDLSPGNSKHAAEYKKQV